MFDQMFSRRAVAGYDVEHTGRQARLSRNLREAERGQWREFGGLQDHRVSGGEGGRDFPRHHQEREIPRDDLSDDTDRHVAGEFGVAELRPAGVVIEVAGDEGNVEIAGLADRLPVVQALEHGQQPRVPLHLSRERIEVARARVRLECRPTRTGGGCGGDRRVDVRLASLRHARQHGLRCGIDRLEVGAVRRGRPHSIDEVAEAAAVVLFDPLECGSVAFRRRPVLHRLEQLGDGRHHTIGWRCAAA